MRLTISTPTAIAVDVAEILDLRAEDESGAFGILPRHADLMTALIPSVLIWRDAAGEERFCAVRGGVLIVRDGNRVAVATREAVMGDDLDQLESEVLRRFRSIVAEEGQARMGEERLQLALMRRIASYLRPGQDGREPPAPGVGVSDLE